jgi:hypothetical protein
MTIEYRFSLLSRELPDILPFFRSTETSMNRIGNPQTMKTGSSVFQPS